MESPDQKELEKFIHAELQKLPERQAPDALVGNVMAAIAHRQQLPWWKQPFTFWPRHIQNLLFVSLAALFALVTYTLGRASENVSLPDISTRLSSYAWIVRTVRSIGEALLAAIPGWPLEWFLAAGLVLALLYGACLAAGFALFRVTAAAGNHAV